MFVEGPFIDTKTNVCVCGGRVPLLLLPLTEILKSDSPQVILLYSRHVSEGMTRFPFSYCIIFLHHFGIISVLATMECTRHGVCMCVHISMKENIVCPHACCINLHRQLFVVRHSKMKQQQTEIVSQGLLEESPVGLALKQTTHSSHRKQAQGWQEMRIRMSRISKKGHLVARV